MEKTAPRHEGAKFETPEEEIAHLRREVALKEKALAEKGETENQNTAITEEIVSYGAKKPEEVLHPKFQMAESESKRVVLELTPEKHDSKMTELLNLMQERGVHNTLSVVQKLNDSHLSDDFHRFLVQYLKAGFMIGGLKEKDSLWRSLKMSLFEITLPEPDKEKQGQRTFKELVSSMEQFYAGMLSVADEKNHGRNHFTLELAVSNHSDEFVFYCAVPDEKRNLFEKQTLSIFPDAKVVEKKDDYNIFNEKGSSVVSVASLKESAVYPIKLYDQFDFDPLNTLLNSFSKIDKDGEGASIQIVFTPVEDFYMEKFKFSLSELQKGVPTKEATDVSYSIVEDMGKSLKNLFIDGLTKKSEKSEEEKKEEKRLDEMAIKQVTAKVSSPVLAVNIRIVASAASQEEASAILSDLESAFNQFEDTHGNKLVFKKLSGSSFKRALDNFTYRSYDEGEACPLSIKEVTTIMHLPVSGKISTGQVKLSKAGTAPAPLDLPQGGTRIGTNLDRGRSTPVYLTNEDRLRHFYAIGQTGTGKTTLLKNMIVQDIEQGNGVCFIDPHGSDVQDVLALIPESRRNDVIYFDPAYTERPMALNMLEYDPRYPEQKTFVVNEMLSIFNKLFDMKTAGGPMFEQYFRNAVLLTIEDQSTGNTLLDVSRVLSNKEFRALKLSHCSNPLVVQFWREVAEKAGGEAALQNIVPYVVSKFDNFLANDIMRPVVAQEHSTFNFREVMDNKKILLVNLSKGRLGDINANLIGLVLVGKILMAALSRVDSLGKDFPPFYLYIDEFQNVTTDSIATILSEARKYRLSLNIAHQFTAQLDEKIKNAVFGNVGSMAVFRVGAEDAEVFEKQMAPVFSARDILNVDNFNAYVKILANGKPVKPFNIQTEIPKKGDPSLGENLKQESYQKFGRPREEVENEIKAKYASSH